MKIDNLGFPKEFTDILQNHLTRYLATDGEEGYLFDSSLVGGDGLVTALILRTIGRKSGRELVLPLFFGEDDGKYVLIASKGGLPNHPAWYHNFMADPVVDVQVKADRFKARARVAEGEERQRLWDMMAQSYAPYNQYQANTDRVIPVVVLERISD